MEFVAKIKLPSTVATKFADLSREARIDVVATMQTLTSRLLNRVKSAAPIDTGKLRAAIDSRVYNDPNRISGRVFVRVDMAAGRTARGSVDGGKIAALEWGAHRTAAVKAHSAQLSHVFGRLIEPMAVMVSAHSRRVSVAEHAFLRRPLAGMASEAVEEIRAAVESANEATS